MLSEEDVDALVSLWSGDWITELEKALKDGRDLALSRKARVYVRGRIEEQLRRGRAGRAANWLAVYVAASGKLVMHEPHFTELFRPSRYADHLATTLRTALDRLAGLFAKFGRAEDLRRLKYITAYVDVFTRTREDEARLLRLVNKGTPSVAALLNACEESFAGFVETRGPMQPRPVPAERVGDLSREDVASAVSYILARFNEVYGITRGRLGALDASGVEDAILLGHFLCELRDAEAQVFFLGYQCEISAAEGLVKLSPPDPRVEMALSFGYLKTRSMGDVLEEQLDPGDEALSLPAACDLFVSRFGKEMLVVSKEFPRRLKFQIPEAAAKILGEKLFFRNEVFREEGIALASAAYELSSTITDLEKLAVTEDLTMRDILQISRVFRFVAMVRGSKLADLKLSDDETVYRNSLLGSGTQSEITALLEACGVAADKARSYLQLYSWDTADKTGIVDLQYRSFVKMETHLVLPFFVHATSNFLRNVMVTSRKRVVQGGGADLVPRLLFDALRARTESVAQSVEYDVFGFRGEIDVMARIGDTIFVFECKNTVLPCNGFEQRTVFEAARDASEQLDGVVAALSDLRFVRWLEGKLGWTVSGAQVATGIVLSNRLLSGARVGGHPVRHVRELVNVLDEGVARFVLGEREVRFSLWRSGKFSAEELREYLSDEGHAHAPVWRACTLEHDELVFSRVRVQIPRAVVDVAQLLDQYAASGEGAPALPGKV